MGILSSIFGGAFGAGPVDGHVGTEEGFVDIDLPISEVKQNRDGSVTIVARGKVNGSVVGLIVDVLPEWEGKEIEGGGATFYWGRARYRSLGEESDRFVAMLAQFYGITPRPMKMLPRIEVSAVGLNDDPMQILETSVKMKFFFEEDSEEGYAEVFTNVDIPNRKFEFHEKDPEYRVPLVQALSGGT